MTLSQPTRFLHGTQINETEKMNFCKRLASLSLPAYNQPRSTQLISSLLCYRERSMLVFSLTRKSKQGHYRVKLTATAKIAVFYPVGLASWRRQRFGDIDLLTSVRKLGRKCFLWLPEWRCSILGTWFYPSILTLLHYL